MNDTIMAGEMEAPKKVAFANRKYSNEDKRKLEEEELKKLMDEQSNSAEEKEEVKEEPEEVKEEEPKEKKDFNAWKYVSAALVIVLILVVWLQWIAVSTPNVDKVIKQVDILESKIGRAHV